MFVQVVDISHTGKPDKGRLLWSFTSYTPSSGVPRFLLNVGKEPCSSQQPPQGAPCQLTALPGSGKGGKMEEGCNVEPPALLSGG